MLPCLALPIGSLLAVVSITRFVIAFALSSHTPPPISPTPYRPPRNPTFYRQRPHHGRSLRGQLGTQQTNVFLATVPEPRHSLSSPRLWPTPPLNSRARSPQLAMKEITESLLPGGSLNPPTKALNPLITTVGCITGPIAIFFVLLKLFWQAVRFQIDMHASARSLFTSRVTYSTSIVWQPDACNRGRLSIYPTLSPPLPLCTSPPIF